MFADVILPLPLEDIFTYTLPPTLSPLGPRWEAG